MVSATISHGSQRCDIGASSMSALEPAAELEPEALGGSSTAASSHNLQLSCRDKPSPRSTSVAGLGLVAELAYNCRPKLTA